MRGFDAIIEKLNAFTNKYYTNLLVKGCLLFFTFGLLFFLVITAVEYFLWLNSSTRLILLVIFILIELALLYFYILTPLFYLFKFKKGISKRDASVLIGKHFPDVNDKLVNLLDLFEYDQNSDLVLAAIEQRSQNLNTVPFLKAIQFKDNLKYVKYIFLPLIIIALLWFSGNIADFFGSYKRVVNYDVAYEPPAPFTFQLLNQDLNVLEDEGFTLELLTSGTIKPDNVSIVIDGRDFLMQDLGTQFQYTLEAPLSSVDFYFTANGFDSKVYQLKVGKVPSIQNFEMLVDYPAYLNKKNAVIKGTGNATIPEGTKVLWKIKGINTEEVNFAYKDTLVNFDKIDDEFILSKHVYDAYNYELVTSNNHVKNYERLGYRLDVIKDAYPTIKVQQTLDSLNHNFSYYSGLASDDNGLKSIQLVYYTIDNPENKKALPLVSPSSTFEQFYYTFPSGLDLEEGVSYQLYFEVFDNDGIHNGKSVKSNVFNASVLNDNQLKNNKLKSQKSILKNLSKSLENAISQKEVLKEISDKQKENRELNFNDKNQIKDFLRKQESQESLMEKFTKELKENLAKDDANDELNQLLQERIERQELEAKKNQKLLEELEKIADKISQEELKKRLEEVGKNQSTNERSLEQILELTKRYYVTEKASQLANELSKLAEEQNELSESAKESDSIAQEQKEVNKQFDQISKELQELKKDNSALKKPLDIDINKNKQQSIKNDQQEALDQLDKNSESEDSKSNASIKQKSASQKMQEMSESLQQSASSSTGGGSSITEDSEMLRQILDNLITFSFKQEELFDKLQEEQGEITQFSNMVRKQKELRGLFEHVDDSLFSLSLRRAELSEFVNEQITEVYYNIDKSLEFIAENQIYQSASYQQYVLNATNSLSDFLADILDNMQQSMNPGQGQGGGDSQLPDIIQGQKNLGEKMGEKGESGNQGKEGQQGEQGTKGQGQKGEGKQGQGQEGQNGTQGDKGSQGKDGQSGSNGQKGNGQDGTNGKGQGNDGNQGNGTNGEGDSKNGDQGQNGIGQGNGDGSNTGGPSEEELKEIYEIYKEQQGLRNQLEDQLKNILQKDKQNIAQKLVRQMEDFENDLLENGITQRIQNKMNVIQQQLLKLENAALKQGEKKERESITNSTNFNNPILTKPSILLNQKNTIEILNRQALPLRQNYKSKVKRYFNDEN